MADNGEINYGVDADISKASAEFNKLKTQISGLTANLEQSQKTIAAAVTRMTADINASIGKAKAGSDQLLALQRRLSRVEGNTLSTLSRGQVNSGNQTSGNQITGAAGRQIISEAANTAENVTAQITNAIIDQYTQKLRTVDEAVTARLRQANFNANKLISSNTPQLLAARQTNQAASDQRTIRTAQVGQSQSSFEQTLDRIGSNGGANLIAVQTKLLAGYAALNLALTGIRNSAQFVVDLDAEFHQFQAITATTSVEMVGLEKNLIKVSEASKFTTLEIAKAATVMGQAGFSADEVGKSIGSIANLATAAGSSLDDAVDVVTSTMSIFNLQTSQAADISNTLTAALNLSKLSMDKLTLGLQYSGNTAAQMGITFQELTGVLGALANSGIKSGSTLGTGLRQLLIDLQNPTKEFTAKLKELGLTQADINIESNGLLPVLNRLKGAGFDAAAAFGSFEVRGAAAYAALSNNTDLAAKLEQQFILSSAAVDANAVQMESLANTYAKFGSVLGTVAYTGLEPLIRVLQGALDGLANMLAKLNEFPAVLNLVGAAVAFFGTTLALNMGVSVIRGMALAFAPLIAATTGVGVASGEAAVGVNLLGLAFKSNPIVLIISLLAAAAVGFVAFSNKVQTVTTQIDALKGSVNTLAAETSTANEQIDSINTTIAGLIKQKDALDKDPLMRNAKILEVKQAFKEVATEVDTTTGTVEELIAALTKLATTDFSKMKDSIRATISGNELLISKQQELFQQNAATGKQNLFNAYSTYADIDPTILPDQATPGSGVSLNDGKKYQDRILKIYNDSLGSAIAQMAEMVFDPSKLPKDVSEAQSKIAQLNNRSNELGTRQSLLSFKQQSGTKLTDAESEELRRIPFYLQLIENLRAQLQPLVDSRTATANLVSQNDILATDLTKSTVGATPQYANLTKKANDINSTIDQGNQDIIRRAGQPDGSPDKLGIDGVNQAYIDLDKKVTEKVNALKDDLSHAAYQIASENPTLKVDDIVKALDPINNLIAGNVASISTNKKAAGGTAAEAMALKREADLKSIDDKIDLQLNQLNKTTTADQIDEMQKYVEALLDQKRKITKDMFDAKTVAAAADATSPIDVLKVDAQRSEAQQEINKQQQAAVDAMNNERNDKALAANKRQKEATDDAIRVQQSKLNELENAIAKASSPEAMDALIAKWNEVALKIAQLSNTSSTLEFQSGVLTTTGRAVPDSQSAKAAEAMQYFMGNGFTQNQAAGIVGNLLAESGLDPNAVGDRGQAKGIAQLHSDRQALQDQFIGANGSSGDNFLDQMRYIVHELNTTESKAGTALKSQDDAAMSADIIRRLYERPTSDPVAGQHQRRIEFANSLAGLPLSGTQQTAAVNQTDLDNSVATGNARITKLATSSALNSDNQQIQTLITQAGIAKNPDTIKTIIASVNDLYKGVIEQKTKQFESDNAAAIKADPEDPAIAEQRTQLLDGIKADQNQKIAGLLNTYWTALDKKLEEPITAAKAKLEQAKLPENVNKFTSTDIQGMEQDVNLAEREAQVQRLAAAEKYLAEVRVQLAATPDNTPEHNSWLLEEANALDRVTQLTNQKNAADAVTAQQGPSVQAAIQAANTAWLQQQGVLDQTGKMIPMAQQVGKAWGGVLDTLQSGFSTLFTDLASGTMSAGEAFKKFALSVIQSFIQMIAKALALQLITSMIGGGSGDAGGGGNFLSSMMGNLFGVVAPGAAQGEYIRGAAQGEVIPGTLNRDSVLRKVMPGEMILRRSAVSSIGQGALEKLNSLGNRSISESPTPTMPANDNSGAGGTVNVWVVSKDNLPQMGPNDIIATVADNIQRRGSIKQLIQQVQIGSI